MELILKETSGPLPTSLFELKEENKILGILQLRHTPSKNNTFPIGFENHIYYEIQPEYKGKGYGTKILALGLDKARSIGLKEVILTCVEENIASQKIIEANKGELIDKQRSSEGVLVYKYRISL